jgi:ABC-2 type transport system permease protein
MLNPVLYMVNVFRYGMLGVSDVNVSYAFAGVIACIVALFSYSLYLLESGKRLRS